MATVIVITNQKGGVGKTTTTAAVATALFSNKKKVLGIDLDPQGNLGFSLGMDPDSSSTIYDVLTKNVPIHKAIHRTDYCDIIPSNILLSSAELELNVRGRELLLKNALEPVKDFYDYIIIDTPPALNILTVNAYTAADGLIIPMVPEILIILGVAQLKETVDSVRHSFNPALNVLGILLTKYNSRTLLAREVKEMAEEIARSIGTSVFHTSIRPGVSVAEAPAHGLSIYDYAPRSNPARDYKAFVNELLTKL